VNIELEICKVAYDMLANNDYFIWT